jgi:hypothetical protein
MLPFKICYFMGRFKTLPLTSQGMFKDNYLQFDSSTAGVYP